ILHHLQCTALVGNPNEIGGYLAAAALACLAMRWWTPGALFLAGLLASRTLTAMIALAVAALAMAALASWRAGLRAARAGAPGGLAPPLRQRAADTVTAARRGEWNFILTERLAPFMAAASMFADRPLTGVGPGAFSWHYYDYKIRAEQRDPSLRRAYHRGAN